MHHRADRREQHQLAAAQLHHPVRDVLREQISVPAADVLP